MYYLMNRDVAAASFQEESGRFRLVQQYDRLPVGDFEINGWLEDRKAYKHNRHLRRLMLDCGCGTAEGFIRVTHAASINDSFWVKREGEEANWEHVSFYRNDFNETISRLAFEGLGLYGQQMSSTSPELTTDGSFRKCWRREDGDIFLYKRGVAGAGNAGLEPYCEALASEIIHKADPSSVQYSVLKFHGGTATKCRVFTNEDVGFVPLRKLVSRGITLDGTVDFFDGIGCREQFQRMLVLDAITFNVDRHLGNMGVLVDNATQEILGIAPNFDFNLSMLPYVLWEEFGDIGRKLLDYGPAAGDDFTRLGQRMLTSEIRRELISLEGFRFSFRGNRDFSPERVCAMEELVSRQIRAVLRGDILYTRDVFVPREQGSIQENAGPGRSGERADASILVEELKQAGCFSSVMEEVLADGHMRVTATLTAQDGFIDITVHLGSMEISCIKDGVEMSAAELDAGEDGFAGPYIRICRAVDDLYDRRKEMHTPDQEYACMEGNGETAAKTAVQIGRKE